MIELQHLSKTFIMDDGYTEALTDVSLSIADGDIYGIIGMSGAGKSTLVRCINMLEKPSSGKVIIDGVDLTDMSAAELREQRSHIAMIFQGFNLLMQRNCLKNICFPLELRGMSKAEAEKRAAQLLEIVGLADKAGSFPAQLSGGQQQRIAIARALAMDPKILLCDEATSALDPTTTNSILELIQDINEKTGITVVVITHQMSVVEKICKHVAVLDQGVVAEEGEVSSVFAHPTSAAAKKLVYPEGTESSPIISDNSQRFVRIVFNGAVSANKPLIASMAHDLNVMANIAAASTKLIGNKMYGSMILGVKTNEEFNKMMDYVSGIEDVVAEEVKSDAE